MMSDLHTGYPQQKTVNIGKLILASVFTGDKQQLSNPQRFNFFPPTMRRQLWASTQQMIKFHTSDLRSPRVSTRRDDQTQSELIQAPTFFSRPLLVPTQASEWFLQTQAITEVILSLDSENSGIPRTISDTPSGAFISSPQKLSSIVRSCTKEKDRHDLRGWEQFHTNTVFSKQGKPTQGV